MRSRVSSSRNSRTTTPTAAGGDGSRGAQQQQHIPSLRHADDDADHLGDFVTVRQLVNASRAAEEGAKGPAAAKSRPLSAGFATSVRGSSSSRPTSASGHRSVATNAAGARPASASRTRPSRASNSAAADPVRLSTNSAVVRQSAAHGPGRFRRIERPLAGLETLAEAMPDVDIEAGDGVPRSRQAILGLIRGTRGITPTTSTVSRPASATGGRRHASMEGGDDEVMLSSSEQQQVRAATKNTTMAAAAASAGAGTDDYGPVAVDTFGCATRLGGTTAAAMGEPAAESWLFPSLKTTTDDVRLAAEKFAEERARLVEWAKAFEHDRAANAASSSPHGVSFDSVWLEAGLAKLKLAGPSRQRDGAAVFRSLGVSYLMQRAIDTLVPATARSLLQSLLVELREHALVGHQLSRESASEGTAPTSAPAAVDDLAPVERPVFDVETDVSPFANCAPSTSFEVVDACVDEWAQHWSARRLTGECLQLERLRRARDMNRAQIMETERTRQYERDVELVERMRELEELAKLRMVVRSWRGYTAQQQRKRRVASSVINSLADHANRERCRAVIYALRYGAMQAKEKKRRERQFNEAASHKLREVTLQDQIQSVKSAHAQSVQDAQDAAESVAEQHWLEMCRVRDAHEEQDRIAKETQERNVAITARNEELVAENRRWALIANRCLLEVTSAVERRTGTTRGHPEVDLLFLMPTSEGEPPVPTSGYMTLADVLDSQMPSQRILMLFANFSVRRCNVEKTVENFGQDVADGLAAACALSLLYPTLLPPAEIPGMTIVARAERVCEVLVTVGLIDIVSPTDILLGVQLRMLTFFSSMFRLYALATRFGTADADHSQLEARELKVLGLRKRRASLGRSSNVSGSAAAFDKRSAGSRSGLAISSSGMDESTALLARHAVSKFSDYDTVMWYFKEDEEKRLAEDAAAAAAAAKASASFPGSLTSRSAGGESPLSAPSDAGPPEGAQRDELVVKKSGHVTTTSVADVGLRREIVTDIDALEERFGRTVERHRAWSYLAELTQRDLMCKLHATRNALTGEVIDERGRRFMEWFLEVDEDRLWRLIQMNPQNAKNEIDKVQVTLYNSYWHVRAVYQAYAARDPGQRMSQDGLAALLNDTGVTKGLGKRIMDEAMRAALEDMDPAEPGTPTNLASSTSMRQAPKKDDKARGDDAGAFTVAFVPNATEKMRRKLLSAMINFQVSPQVFIVVLCFLAHIRYKDTEDDDAGAATAAKSKETKKRKKKPAKPEAEDNESKPDGDDVVEPAADEEEKQLLPLHKCLRKLLAVDIVGVAQSSTIDMLRMHSHHPLVQKAHKKYARSITKVFRTYATAGGGMDDKQMTTAAAIAAAKGKHVGAPKYMTPDDTVRFCRDVRIIDGRFAATDVITLATALSMDDERLQSVCDESRTKAFNAQQSGSMVLDTSGATAAEQQQQDTSAVVSSPAGKSSSKSGPGFSASTVRVPFEVDSGQPEDRRQQGMAVEDFYDFITGVALTKNGHPLSHACNVVASFYIDTLGPNLRELHF